ncbi:hypothetical protein PHLCEN_2v6441 [Hermanssonia centrifuga]|uniref:Uncharacterized protein n=1 Tax=Hermanssonia centrifuga TaxID=98765 RepID=A0A2R6NZJ1_9APHY|nr:hypothetical protein PHLCEN_2v6441 [Hermanssonia centrifuga]
MTQNGEPADIKTMDDMNLNTPTKGLALRLALASVMDGHWHIQVKLAILNIAYWAEIGYGAGV